MAVAFFLSIPFFPVLVMSHAPPTITGNNGSGCLIFDEVWEGGRVVVVGWCIKEFAWSSMEMVKEVKEVMTWWLIKHTPPTGPQGQEPHLREGQGQGDQGGSGGAGAAGQAALRACALCLRHGPASSPGPLPRSLCLAGLAWLRRASCGWGWSDRC